VASPRGKNKETNYRRYCQYHRYFKSKIPVYGQSLLTSHTASILANYLTSLISPVLRLPVCQRAINNIYSSLGVHLQPESVYVTSRPTLNTFLRYNGHRYIGGSSTTHCRLAPLPKEPSRISPMYLIFLETRMILLQFMSIFIQFFFWWAPQLLARLLYF